jgi:hypothetical protein
MNQRSGTRIITDQEDALGRDIDTLDNLAHALLLPMPAEFHVEQFKSSLPELVAKFKKDFAAVVDWNPWEHEP